MARKPQSQDVPMEPLNVDIPADVLTMLRVAKATTGKAIRQIALEALEAWLRQNGITRDKVDKLKGK
jgi:hypothetical protein